MPEGLPGVNIVAQRAKPWWKSRTLWFNALVAGLAAAEANFKTLEGLLPVNTYQALTFALVMGNALLRFATTSGVTLK